jgi:aerobactin synthase
LASLLAVGSDGRALAAELLARSGLPARDWLTALIGALLPPILHYFYAYGVALTPHGENVVVIFDGAEVPRRIAVKDFGADVELVEGEFSERAGMPAAVRAHCRGWPAPVLAHSIQSAIFAGNFRYFSVVVEDHLGVAEDEFWRLVCETVEGYQRRFPDYAGRFAAADLFAPTFGRVCLNREHFGGAGFHDRAERDAGFDVIHGEVANPLYLVAQPGPPQPGPPQSGPPQSGHARSGPAQAETRRHG